MTEQDPPEESEDTQPLPDDHSHRYDTEGISPSTVEAPGASSYLQRDGQLGEEISTPRSGRRFAAGLVAAALVVGGLSGVAGAAGFTALHHDTDNAVIDATAPVSNASPAAAQKGTPQQVAQAVLPSVVQITVKSAQQEDSGSGIILSSDGYILTNNHVVAAAGGSGTVSVDFNNGAGKLAKVVGTDPVTDLAVIKVDGVSNLKPATIGSSNALAVGQQVVAIGSPFGLESTVTSGIVSALNRPVQVGETQNTDTIYPAIQTDAAINPGNSGGPLVNMAGQVIGINSSIFSASNSSGLGGGQAGSIGLGFAIPISTAWPVVQQLWHGLTPTHALMGVSVTDASSNNGLLSGAGIESVNAGSAAQKAGLVRGDVITKVNEQRIPDQESLVATIRGFRPGDKVTITYYGTDKKTHTTVVTLGSDQGSSSS
jgi:putative serine protease PepD